MYERIQGNDMYNAGPNVPFSSNVTFNNGSLANPSTILINGQTRSRSDYGRQHHRSGR